MTQGSGDVFIDLGFDPAEAEALAIRTEAMIRMPAYLSTDEQRRQHVIDSAQRGEDGIVRALHAVARSLGSAVAAELTLAEAIAMLSALGLRLAVVPNASGPIDGMPPTHPGELLREEYLAPLGMTVSDLAVRLHVAAERVQGIVDERAHVDADIALRLSRYFGGTAKFWLALQATYDLKTLPTRAAIEQEVQARVAPGW